MSFAEVHEAHNQLRLRLQVHVGDKACSEVTVSIPKGDADELSFLRLVVWSYVLVQESGRVALRFLKDLPPFSSGPLLPEVSYLRTWATHNLLPDKASDRKQLMHAWAWLKRACDTDMPSAESEWRACFQRLNESLAATLRNAVNACDALTSPEDGPRLIEELSRRVDRNWDAYRFDQLVDSAVSRLGYDGIETVEFRRKHLNAWRQVVAVAQDDEISRLLELRIETDLLDLMNRALPITAREVITHVSMQSPKEMGIFLLSLRERTRSTNDSIQQILDEIGSSLETAPSSLPKKL